MHNNLQAFYIVVTQKQTWGKALSLKDALKNAHISTLTGGFCIYTGLCKEGTTREQLENLAKCFNVDDFGGVRMYNDPSEEDRVMVKEQMIGWHTNNDFLIDFNKKK